MPWQSKPASIQGRKPIDRAGLQPVLEEYHKGITDRYTGDAQNGGQQEHVLSAAGCRMICVWVGSTDM